MLWMSLPSITDADAVGFEVGLIAVKALTAQDGSFHRKADGGQEGYYGLIRAWNVLG
jgi:hypothetical protein